jgi:2'-5' RNA ligase
VSEGSPLAPNRARVFFALWPDERIQAHLQRQGRELLHRLSGKLTRTESIHLTLAVLGDVTLDRLAVATEAATGVWLDSFSLCVDQAGCWRHNGVGWVAPSRVPQALLALVQGLEGRLRDAGFELDDRPYSPHITLVRKARCVSLDLRIEPVEWPVHDFVLVQSELEASGSRYTIVGRWPKES